MLSHEALVQSPRMVPKSFPLVRDSGVLFQGPGYSVLPLTSQSQKERLPRRWELSGGQAGAFVGSRGPQSWGAVSGSWLCPEWPWTNPSSPCLASVCPCQVLRWSLRPLTPSPLAALGLPSIILDPPQRLPLAGGLSSLGVWGSLPYLLLEMRVFLRKLPQVWGTLIGTAQVPLAWLLKSQAPFSVVQQ